MSRGVHRLFFVMTLFGACAVGSVAATLADRVELNTLDGALLARAIFEETNRVRVQLGLPAFAAEPKLTAAAETQARIGSVFQKASHTNPFPSVATPADRVKSAGLPLGSVAENVALFSAYVTEGRADFYQLKGDPTLRDAKTDAPLPRHTYATFAQAIVDAWMRSPGHRANIVDPQLRQLGCAVHPAGDGGELAMIFSVQVFYSPPERRRK